MLHMQIVLCCVAHSYLDIKQIEAACLLLVRGLPALHCIFFLFETVYMLWVTKL